MDEIEFESELTFSNVSRKVYCLINYLQVDYIFSLSIYKISKFDSNFRMVIDCESKYEGLIWRGDFQQKYIEEITNKAGNYKKFPVFSKMLMTAMKKEAEEEIYLDLLTA